VQKFFPAFVAFAATTALTCCDAKQPITKSSSSRSRREFAGKDYERAVIAPGAGELLTHYDERSQHYETLLTPAEVRTMAGRASGRNRVV
jgi:hypothetical protein